MRQFILAVPTKNRYAPLWFYSLNLAHPEIIVASAPLNKVKAEPNNDPSLLDPLHQEGHDESQKLAVFIDVLLNCLVIDFGLSFNIIWAIIQYYMSNCWVCFICSLLEYK